jgi:aminoglycoside phosphotransferase (APT) family kinase protein
MRDDVLRPDALLEALRTLPALGDLPAAALEPMPARGVAHEHLRLKGRGLVARVPRWSQVGLEPLANLNHQAAAFARAAASGHTPHLAGVLSPRPGLPMGALVVGEVVGRPPRLPDDMPAIAAALAALHRLPVPLPDARPPLASPADAVAATLAVVERQAAFFAAAGLTPPALAVVGAELEAARAWRPGGAAAGLAAGLAGEPPGESLPVTLVGTDTHPGNFLVDADGRAWFTDLEKAQYGHPAIDLAHASLITSTTWDPEVSPPGTGVLTAAEVADFHAAWAALVPAALAAAVGPVLAPLRRLTWLRTLSWMARWRVEGERLAPGMPESLRLHLAARIADAFAPQGIGRARADWHDTVVEGRMFSGIGSSTDPVRKASMDAA